jgi:hypothetical protein
MEWAAATRQEATEMAAALVQETMVLLSGYQLYHVSF